MSKKNPKDDHRDRNWPKFVDLQWGAELWFKKIPKIKKVKFDRDLMFVELRGGFIIRINYYGISKTLKNASIEQLKKYKIVCDHLIHWDDLDEHVDIVNYLGKYP